MQVRLSDGGETKARRWRGGERWQLAYSTAVGCTGPVICYGHAVMLHHCFRRPHGTAAPLVNMSDPPMRDGNLLIGSIRFVNGKCTYCCC